MFASFSWHIFYGYSRTQAQSRNWFVLCKEQYAETLEQKKDSVSVEARKKYEDPRATQCITLEEQIKVFSLINSSWNGKPPENFKHSKNLI